MFRRIVKIECSCRTWCCVKVIGMLVVMLVIMMVISVVAISHKLSLPSEDDDFVLLQGQVSRTTKAIHEVQNKACLKGNATRLRGLTTFEKSKESYVNRSVHIGCGANGCDIDVVTVRCWIFPTVPDKHSPHRTGSFLRAAGTR
jgi:hypothetical protein